MRALYPLAALLVVCTCSCSYIVTSTEKVVQTPERENLGLAGSWKPIDDRNAPDSRKRDGFVIAGPDAKGVYTFEGKSGDTDGDHITADFTVERISEDSNHCLVDGAFRTSPMADASPSHILAYCVVKDMRLTIWPISSEKLREQLKRSDINAVIEYSWPFVNISEHGGALRNILRENAKELVDPPQVFTSD